MSLRRVRQRLPIVGLLIAAAVLATLATLDVPVGVEAGSVAAMVAGAFLAKRFSASPLAVPLAVVPGALWLAIASDVTELAWVRVAMVLFIPLAGYLITDFEKRYEGMGLGVIFFTLACLGVFVAVPDTEWSRSLIAVSLPLVFLAWPRVLASLGVEGAYAAVAVFVIVTAQGGSQRPASIVGGLACLGLLLLEPITIATSPEVVKLTTWPRRNWAGAVLASLPQFAVVALCSRVAARFTDEIPALVVVVVVYVATVAVGISAATGDILGRREA